MQHSSEGKELLARGWDEISWHMDDFGLACRIKDMPANQTSCFDMHHMVDCSEVAKFALYWWVFKIIEQWSR